MKGLNWFSKLVYSLASINLLLISVFYYKLSDIDSIAYDTAIGNGFGFWIDYLIYIILTALLPAYLHHIRYDFKDRIAGDFQINNELHAKILMVVGCDVLPCVILFSMSFHTSNWVFLGSGPGA